MRTIAVVNNKGGVGKTSTVRNLAGLNAQKGRQTVAIDLDQQANLSSALGVPPSNAAYDVLTGAASFQASLKPCPNVDGLYVLAGGPALEYLARKWDSREDGSDAYHMAMFERLRDGIDQFRDWVASQGLELDLVIIDNGPSFSGLFEVACMVSTHCIVPINPLIESVQGLGTVHARVLTVRAERGANVKFLGAFINEFEKKTFQKETLIELKEILESAIKETLPSGGGEDNRLRLLATIIPNNSSIAECVKGAMPVTVAYPDSDGSTAYRRLLKEIDDATLGVKP